MSQTERTLLWRSLAEASHMLPLPLLRDQLLHFLPYLRVDVLADGWRFEAPLVLTTSPEFPPAHAARSSQALVTWLEQMEQAVAVVPILSEGNQLGQVVVSCGVPDHYLSLQEAGEHLASLLCDHLLRERYEVELATRDTYIQQLEQRLRETDDLRLRATLAAGAAHDMNNLMASVLGYIQLIGQEIPVSVRSDLESIEQAVRDTIFLLRRVNSGHHPMMVSPTPVSFPSTIIQDAIRLTRPFWEPRGDIRIRTLLPPSPPVRAHATELREVVINLIMNALNAMPQGGMLTFRTVTVGERVTIEIADTGSGVSSTLREAIFQPSVTTRANGVGLGLSVSRAIVESYGGQLALRSNTKLGATFALDLPALRSLDGLYEYPVG